MLFGADLRLAVLLASQLDDILPPLLRGQA